MTCDELRDHYELYAMGVLEDPERAEIRLHLGRGCDLCTAEVKRALALVARVGAAAPPVDPPARLRKRILAAAGVEQPRGLPWWSLAWAAAAMLCLAAALYFGGRQRDYSGQMARMRQELRRQSIELTRLNEAFAILNGPDTAEAAFGPNQPRGKVYLNPRAGVLLIASNLPPAGPGKTYEMWVIPKGGKPVPAGTFQSGEGGSALHILPGPVDIGATGAVAVTVENEGGAPQPTSTPIIVASVGAG